MMAVGMAKMERLRVDLIQRARTDRQQEPDQRVSDTQPTSSPTPRQPDQVAAAQDSSRSQTTRFLPPLPHIFGRRTGAPRTPRADVDVEAALEVPKSPEVESMRHHRPSLRSTRTNGLRLGNETEPSWPMGAAVPAPPPSVAVSESVYSVNPPPTEPASGNTPDRARHGRRQRPPAQESERPAPPKKFMLCLPWVQSQRVRTQAVRLFVSGFFIAMLLAVYIGLAVSHNVARGEFTIMVLLVILCAVVFFTLSFVRLCILIFFPNRARRRDRSPPSGPAGYAVPRQPIRVTLARDEEAAGVENKEAPMMPPAYGLWRESVRVDPNRLFWQRNEAVPRNPAADPEATEGPRPPSYISEDGVSYVVEATPRSTAPTAEVRQITHPHAVGRVGHSLPPR